MAITCTYGHENLEGMSFCEECGAELTSLTDRPLPDAPLDEPEAISVSAGLPADQAASIPPPQQTPSGPIPLPRVPASPERVAVGPLGNPLPPVVPTGGPRAWLEVTMGPAAGRMFDVVLPSCVIGRWDMDSGAFPEIDLTDTDADAKVSRKHARIDYRDGRFVVEDLGSLNGTSHNRRPRMTIGSAEPLEDGDELIVGRTFLRFRTEGR